MNKPWTRRSGVVATAVLATTVVTGCAIHQNVRPISQPLSDRQICLIDNPTVKASFQEAYKRALTTKGYIVRALPANATITDCPVTSTYTANWRWDLALYMAYAEIRVFNNGNQLGEAKYDAMSGSGSLNKFIDADKKINELVNQLFPGGAGTAAIPGAGTSLAPKLPAN